ncbi:MAG: hypothetical protein NTY10_06085 [Candidatus Omnitrophica bacterium]|nr:hypothetical protein [Candidatus Omnitrophota bacterium]
MARILSVLGLLVLMAAIIASLMASHYKKAYLNEKASGAVVASALLTLVQDNLLKASLAVNQGNFGDAKIEIAAAKKNINTFSSLSFSKEIKETASLSTSIMEIEVDLASANSEAQKKILALAGTITDLLVSSEKK